MRLHSHGQARSRARERTIFVWRVSVEPLEQFYYGALDYSVTEILRCEEAAIDSGGNQAENGVSDQYGTFIAAQRGKEKGDDGEVEKVKHHSRRRLP